MNTIELYEQAKEVATRLGWRVRQEYLGGAGGGSCQCRGEKWIFIDLALSPADQLEQITNALREDRAVYSIEMAPQLAALVHGRRQAA